MKRPDVWVRVTLTNMNGQVLIVIQHHHGGLPTNWTYGQNRGPIDGVAGVTIETTEVVPEKKRRVWAC